MSKKYTLLFGLLFFLLTVVATGQDWLGFHGLERQGVNQSTTSTVAWVNEVDVSWKTPIPGFGFSSPVVSSNRIYLTTAYETDRGYRFKRSLAQSTLILAWVLLAIASVAAIRTIASNWSGRGKLYNNAKAFLLMSVVYLVLGTCLFANSLFGLESSVFRSWKVGTFATFLCLVLALLFSTLRPAALWAFAASTTALSWFTFQLIPPAASFLNFRSSDGIASTAAVFGPALIGWTICLGLILVPKKAPASDSKVPRITLHSRKLRIAICFAFPVFLAAGIFWALVARIRMSLLRPSFQAPDETTVAIGLTPTLGWSLLILSVILCAIATVAGSRFIYRRQQSERPLLLIGAATSLVLGISCFLWFGASPSQRQIAYAVICIDEASGSTRWLREVAYGTDIHDFKGVNSQATPTVAIGSVGLCAYFGSAGLFGLDWDGNITWKVHDADFESPYGVGHSPVVSENIIVLGNDNESYPHAQNSDSHMIGFDLKDGHVLWRQERDRSAHASAGFGTPIIRTIGGQKTILMRGWEDLTAYDLHTGEIRWSLRLKYRGNHLVAGPVADDSRIYLLDATRMMALDFDDLAQNREATAWTLNIPGEKASTPVLVNGLLYLATETGNAYCIDAETGTVEWKQKLGKRFFSSVVVRGNIVVFADESGDVSFVKNSRTFELVHQPNLGEKVYSTPVPQVNGILVRAVTNIFYLKPGPEMSRLNANEGQLEPPKQLDN